MDLLELETTYVPHLRGQFASGSVVLFLGAGFSLDARNTSGDSIPSAAQLTDALWKLCFPEEAFDPTTQLQDIFETAQNQKSRQLADLLRRFYTVDPESCPKWYRELLTMPWLRIYTLNIDDLVTKLLSTESNPRPVQPVSAMTATTPIFHDTKLSVVHLNGTLDDVPNNVTFSRSQFARRIGTDPAYVQLRNDLLFRSVVFIGASMEEGPLWAHLELRGSRGDRGQRELRPRSYLVTPALNRSKEALLSRYNVVWLQNTAEEFNSSVLSAMKEERVSGQQELRRLTDTTTSSPDRFSVVSDLAPRDSATEEYLLGAEPTWDDVTSNRVAQRVCFDELWELISDIRANPTKRRFIVLTGTAGTGKSSALMVAALRLETEGVRVGWVDSDSFFNMSGFRQALESEPAVSALFINDSDLYDSRLSVMVRNALEHNPKLIVVCEARSTKVDRIVNKHELSGIEAHEYIVPPLGDSDIDEILNVLDREHRLGMLKGMAREERHQVFRGLAGRQLLVAMHIATHGREFEEKAQIELKEMAVADQFMYGLISVATAHRFALRQEDIGIACGTENTAWLQILDALERRKLILPYKGNSFRARHRVIAQFVYDSLTRDGKLHGVVHGLIRIGATRTTSVTPPEALHSRLLRTFLNHNLMKRSVGESQAREIYGEYEDALAWSYHYWLHRGALELETDNLDRAENFLKQAKSINERDVYIDNELAYLLFKKAVANPQDSQSLELVDDAIATLNETVRRRPDQIAHAYHIMGTQGLVWAGVGILEVEKKKEFLEYLLQKVRAAVALEQSEMMRQLRDTIQRTLLSLAVDDSSSEGSASH